MTVEAFKRKGKTSKSAQAFLTPLNMLSNTYVIKTLGQGIMYLSIDISQ